MRTKLNILLILTCFVAPGLFLAHPVYVESIVISGTIEPTFYGRWDPGWIHVETRDFEIASDGYIYQVGQSSNPSVEDERTFHLLKWSPTAELVWNRTWDWSDRARVYGMTAHNSFIYTVGCLETDTLVVKWSSSGDVIWSRTWNWTSGQRALDAAVDSVGNVIVLTVVYDHNETASQQNLGLTVLLKYDSAGNFLANYTGGYCYGRDVDLKIADDGFVYALVPLYGSIMQWSPSYSLQWILYGPFDLFDVSSEGNFVVAASNPPFTVRKFDSNMNEIWNVTDGVVWEEFIGNLQMYGSLDVSLDDSTFFLYKVYDNGTYPFVLDKFDSSGTLEWNRTLVYPETWDQEWGESSVPWAFDMRITSKEVIYISAFDYDGDRLGMGIIVYGTPTQVGLPPDPILLIIAVCMIVGVIAIIIILKKR
ncbi:MAG: hypothetical protein ACW98Y_22215 [Candidatus Thorarchaeota archaeon]|jgi:hypothetical protein